MAGAKLLSKVRSSTCKRGQRRPAAHRHFVRASRHKHCNMHLWRYLGDVFDCGPRRDAAHKSGESALDSNLGLEALPQHPTVSAVALTYLYVFTPSSRSTTIALLH
jgi:hypothetical protein